VPGWLRFALGLAAVTLPTLAAISVTGRVVDETSAGIDQARVTLRLADTAASGIYSTVSDPTGAFTLSLPGPGRYLATVERDGYFPLKDHAIEIMAESAGIPGEAQDLHLTLSHEREVFQSVNVNASPAAIDVDKTSAERKLTGVEIVDIPYSPTRDLRMALTLLPGVIEDQAGGLHFDGGAENQTLYLLDGFNVGDPLTGKLNTHVSVESVRSADWVSGRYSPEFGKGSAGALDIHTDMGDNPWRYSATNFIPGFDTRTGLHLDTWEPQFNLSGPIVPGRAWFSDHLDADYAVPVVPGLPQGQNRTQTFQTSNIARGQVDLTPSNILFVDYLVNYTLFPENGLAALNPASTTTDQRARIFFVSAKDQIYLTRGMLLEVGLALNSGYMRSSPQGSAPYGITPFGNQGNYYINSAERSRREQFLANLFLPSFEWHGHHQWKTGTDLDRLNYWQNVDRTGIDVYNVAGMLARQTAFGGSGLLSQPGLEASWYLLDDWKVRPSLAVEMGAREDWDELLRRPAISPRIAASWAPFGLKDTKISAGYAILRDATSLQLFARPHDQYGINTFFSPDGSVASGPLLSVFEITDPRLKVPLYQNWTLGVERRLPGKIDVTSTYLRKRGSDGLAYTNLLTEAPPSPALIAEYGTNQFGGVYDLTNSRRDVYDAVEIAARQRFGEGYEWMVSYTRSRAWSSAVVDMTADQPLQVLNNSGPVSWDAPNRIVSWGYLPTKWSRWALAYALEARSGLPYSVVNGTGQVVGGVNSQRFPFYFSMNVHPEVKFTLFGVRWAVRGGFNNITDHENPTVAQTIPGLPVRFYGSDKRHFVFRVRWLGKETAGT
jgi:hypothetical protein